MASPVAALAMSVVNLDTPRVDSQRSQRDTAHGGHFRVATAMTALPGKLKQPENSSRGCCAPQRPRGGAPSANCPWAAAPAPGDPGALPAAQDATPGPSRWSVLAKRPGANASRPRPSISSQTQTSRHHFFAQPQGAPFTKGPAESGGPEGGPRRAVLGRCGPRRRRHVKPAEGQDISVASLSRRRAHGTWTSSPEVDGLSPAQL